MKISDIIKQLQEIQDEYGDEVTVAFGRENDWRRFASIIKPRAEGLVDVVDGDYDDYVPVSVVNHPRGYTDTYARELKKRKSKQVLVVYGLG